MSFNFEELEVYNKAIDFISNIYTLTKNFPKDEMFGLTSRMRRAVVSISSNISEGSARTKKDFGRFIDIARGLVMECVTLLQISVKQHHIDGRKYYELRSKLTELSKMLSGLKKSVNR